MSTPILATKLFIPPARPSVVSRPRLMARLNEGLHRRLTLLSAPAGFGKTTLVSEWLAALEGRPAAWLSLDEGDRDPTRFLAYLIAALQTVVPTLGEGVLGALHSPPPPGSPLGPEALLTPLLNEIAALSHPLVLVLDDYHVVDAQAVDQALTFLLDHLPPQMHLVITTREDPPLPLARYRVRGQMTEVRATDLRFTPAEAAGFLNQVMGLNLSPAEVTALESRTEGWIAGLQLAALSMQGHQDVAGFIRAFAGDHRYIVDYLMEEVLHQQPASVQTFLLHTSILERLCGPLCEAVTQQSDGSARLELLGRGNFFVVPLDDKRLWYRYHHLFADVLHARLMEDQPDQIATLHQRASEWYAENGLPADAIRHALAAQDFGRAAGLIERVLPTMRQSRQETTVLGWLKALPDAVVRVRPVLSVHYAGGLLLHGESAGVEARLRDAEQWLETTTERHDRPHLAGAVVVDEEEFRRLPATIALYRAAIALVMGDIASTMKYARQVLDLSAVDDHLRRGAAAGLLGLAYWTMGNLDGAHQAYADCMTSLQRAGYIADAVGCALALADLRIEQGRLHEAMRTYEQALQLTTSDGPAGSPTVLRGTADMHVGMSQLYRERNDLTTATQHLLRSKELGEHMGLRQNPYRWHVAMARIREAEGDLEGALDLLRAAERLYASDFFPNVHPLAAMKTRVWVAQGRLGEALGWAREQGLSAHDDLSYLREFEHITLARVLLARYKSDRADQSLLEAMGLLARLLPAAEAGQRKASVLEILVLHALANQMLGDIPAALGFLARALTLAEPEGYVRLFVDEGPPMTQLLREAAACGIMPVYTGKLLAAFGVEQASNVDQSPLPLPTVLSLASQFLIEPLSQRELEVLRLFRTELSGPEIAQELMVALSTIRTHTKGIFSKLHVNNRREAVKRAEELDLI